MSHYPFLGENFVLTNLGPRILDRFAHEGKTFLHTFAKLIEIKKTYLQKIHGLHELGSRMECKDTLHGSGLGPHWVLGPNYSKFGPMGPKNFAQKFLYTK